MEIDSLEIKIHSEVAKLGKELDEVASKMGVVSKRIEEAKEKASFKPATDSAKSMASAMKSASDSMMSASRRSADALSVSAKTFAEREAQLREVFADLGKNTRRFQLYDTDDKVAKKIEIVERELEQLYAKREQLGRRTNSSGEIVKIEEFDKVIKKIVETENQMDVLRSKLSHSYKFKAEISPKIMEGYELLQQIHAFSEDGLLAKNVSYDSEEVQSVIAKVEELRNYLLGLLELPGFADEYGESITRFSERVDGALRILKDASETTDYFAKKGVPLYGDRELKSNEVYTETFIQMKKEIQNTEKELNKLLSMQRISQKAGENQDTVVNRKLAVRIEEAKQKLRELNNEMFKLKVSGEDFTTKESVGFMKLSQSMSNAGVVLNRFAGILRVTGQSGAASFVQKFSAIFNKAGIDAGKMGKELEKSGQTAEQAFGKAGSALSGFLTKLMAGSSKIPYIGIIIAAVIGAIVVKIKLVQSELKLVKNIVSTVAKGFVKLWQTVGKVAKSIVSIGSNSYQALTPIGKFINKIINTFKSRILRQGITKALQYVGEGFKNLAEYSRHIGSDFHNTMTVMYSDLKWLGRTVATAFEPIMNAARPVFDFLIRKVIDVINVFNQMFAALTGAETWTKAIYYAEEYGEETDKAGKSVAKLNKQLRSFDELNNITTNDGKSGGSGNKDSIDVDNMFSTENVEGKIKNFVDKIKKAFEVADFTDIGRIIGDKFGGALDKIEWGSIQESAKKIGSSVGTLITGFVETPNLGSKIGWAIGDGINTALSLFSGFVNNTHFDSIGTFVGNAVSGALTSIKWDEFIHDMGALGEGIADGINALAQTNVLRRISMATAKLVKAGIEGAWELVGNIKFNDLGDEFGKAITDFFEEMNKKDESGKSSWEKLGETATGLVSGLTHFIVHAVGKIDEGEIRESIQELLSGIDFKKMTFDVALLVATLETHILHAILTAINNVTSKFNIFTYIFNKDDAEKEKGNASKETTNFIKGALSEAWTNAKDWWDKHRKLNNLYANVSGFKDKLKEKWDIANEWWKTHRQLYNVTMNVDDIKTKLSEKWTTARNWWINNKPALSTVTFSITDIKASLSTMWTNARTWWANKPKLADINIGNNLVSSVQSAWNSLRGWWQNKPKLSEIVADIKLPKFKVNYNANGDNAKWWKTLGFAGTPYLTMYYAQGGFPEDGWFRASHGELMGKFDNGQTVVANNKQIIDGIKRGVAEGQMDNTILMRQEIDVLRQQNEILQRLLEKEVGISESALFKSVRKSANEYQRTTGNPAFNI